MPAYTMLAHAARSLAIERQQVPRADSVAMLDGVFSIPQELSCARQRQRCTTDLDDLAVFECNPRKRGGKQARAACIWPATDSNIGCPNTANSQS